MDDLLKHLAPHRRLHPVGMPVDTIGWLPRKANRTNAKFKTTNFSFILSGRGDYSVDGCVWPVEAPCVITQWPGPVFDYGAATGETWTELFLIFPQSISTVIQERRFFDPSSPTWKIAGPRAVGEGVERLLALIREETSSLRVDWLDRLCEQLILTSLIGDQAPVRRDSSDVIRTTSEFVSEHSERDHDFESIAAECGMSYSTFRRRWQEVIGVPPRAFLLDARTRQARRMLVESKLAVSEIAEAVGFEDPLYFSRSFRRVTGLSPREYRVRHAIPM